MKTLIIGLGKSGLAAAELLQKEGHTLYGVDRDEKKGIDFITFTESSFPETLFFNQAIISPGISQTHPLVQKIKQKGVPIFGEIELAFQRLDQPCIGITGTNGKTTTTALLAHVFNENSRPARAVGNIGYPLCHYLLNPKKDETLMIELSSFQLETAQTRVLDAAVILNITPDHLDRYSSFEAYAQAKFQIQNCIKTSGKLFISKETQKKFEKYLGEIETITFGEDIHECVDLIGRFFGLEATETSLASFKRPPHRLEMVREISGVRFINDSKATNTESVLFALRQISDPLIVIVGGRDKGSDFHIWRSAFGDKVKRVVGYGEAARKIKEHLCDVVPFELCQTLEQAVGVAYASADQRDVVLLSPGCASFDAFLNYEERGDVFKHIVNKLTSKEL